MEKRRSTLPLIGGLFVTMAVAVGAAAGAAPDVAHLSARTRDWRNILTGSVIPDQGYCDQPYVIVNKDGSWTCTVTTGRGHEGSRGQHIVSSISTDQGKTWGPLVDIEPETGPEASWVVPRRTDYGRIYGFYTYNGDNIRPGRSDTHGWYCYKYSDDNGKTWSDERYRIPMRETAADRHNGLPEGCPHFWGIDKPKVDNGVVRFAFTKLGKYFLGNGEGFIVRSDNLMTERDPAKINWEILPEGDHGVRVPAFGSIQTEFNHVPLGGNRLYMVYRTTLGYPIHCYSEDGGESWSTPEHMTHTPDGRRIETPRACPKLWRCKNGKYLFWFHNHNGRTFRGRNPVWLTGGILKGGKMHWSQPEILLYHHVPKARGMSYPDLIEQDGRYWVTETQKTAARVHEIPVDLLEGLWGQVEGKPAGAEGAILSLSGDETAPGKTVDLPELPDLSLGGGFSVDTWLKLAGLEAGQTILDSRDDSGCGFAISTGEKGSLVFVMGDGLRNATWTSEPGLLTAGKLHHVVIIADGGPCIISVVRDGVLCDGGPAIQYGWGRFDQKFGSPSGGPLRVAPALKGAVKHVRIYDRYLRTSEAVGNFRVGCPAVR